MSDPLDQLAQPASPLPFEVKAGKHSPKRMLRDADGRPVLDGRRPAVREANLVFLANAANAYRGVVARVLELEAENARLRGVAQADEQATERDQ